MKFALFLLPLLIIGVVAQAAGQNHGRHSKYAGQERRGIKSLSAADIAELRRGGGWGLAKAAELNGLPGPAHLLEMHAQIPLRPDQVMAIQALFDEMKARAIEKGELLIALERRLEDHFQNRTMDQGILARTLGDIAAARKDLRYIHLSTHLQTPGILSARQIKRYNKLRGYGAPDPCADVPAGRDAKMWRQHNGCN